MFNYIIKIFFFKKKRINLCNLARICYEKLFESGINQSILISGESGSGKTESNKLLLNFLAKMVTGTICNR